MAAARSLYLVFIRALGGQATQAQEEVKRKRSFLVFGKGEVVFRRMPGVARPPKYMLGEPSRSPSTVMDQLFGSVRIFGHHHRFPNFRIVRLWLE